MAETQIQNVSHRHEYIIDWLLANPSVKSLQSLCDELNISRSWLSIVMNSDAFKLEYSKRRAMYNEVHGAAVQTKLHEAAIKALDKLIDALDDEEIDPRLALDAVDKTTNRLGYGAKPGNTPQVSVHAGTALIVDKSMLAQAREKMRTTIDAEPVPDEG